MTTDPTTLAREVLDIQDRHRSMNARTGLDLPIDINDMAELATAAPALARAVLTCAELERYFEDERDTSNTKDEAIAWDNAATLIHNALDGNTND